MKRSIVYGLAIALLASCSTKELDTQKPFQDDVTFFASFEQPDEAGTRVFANEEFLLRWNADDRVSIFNKNTYNQQYKFTGDTGDNAGGFDKVEGAEFTTGNAIPHVVSVYPYRESTEISESETITVSLPAEQHYAENTFGLGANPMVSVTSDNFLLFKNVGGYLRLSLYGDGVSVSSITLKGNNGEKLAGKATVVMPQDGTPTVAMEQDATEEITLVCDSPVVLGTTVKDSVDFWFVVPPVTFSKGFTITVAYTGGVSEKVTTKSVTIARNNLSKMSPVEIELSQPNNVIYYTSSDGTVVTPDEPGAFGANIVSNDYIDGRGVITFDGDITHVGDYAFSQTRLSSISLPNSVLGIGKLAFYECDGLVSINIPEGVTSIGQQAFDYCSSLISISFPKSVDSIGEWAFHDCGSLVGITVDPQNLVFDSRNNCNAIIETTTNTLVRGSINTIIPEDVINIGATAFSGCSELSQIIIPDNVKSIGKSAFSGTGLTSITIPDGITSIESNTFRACEKLVSVSLPDSVVNIDTYAFGQCTSLSSISIPHNVKSIGSHAFDRCTSLTSVSVPGSVDAVEDYVFLGCSSLISVSIENGVKSIGYAAFWDCSELVSIELPNSLTSIGDGAFVNCSRLDSITIPASVTSMGEFAFGWCTGLSSLSLSDGLSCIGEASFYSCSRLSTVTIPDSVTSIGESAFEECTNLANIIILSNLPPSGSQYMFDNTNNCPILVPAESVETYKSAQYWSDYANRICTISPPNNVIYYTSSDGTIVTPKDVFDASIVSNEYSDGLGIITFDRDVRFVGEAAFSQCQRLTSINLPANVRSIGRSAFSYCTSLANITTPEGLTSIGSFAFGGCSNLSSITMPESVISIGDHAFSGCSSLSSITIPESVTSIMEETFRGCSSLLSFNGKYASSDGLFLIDQGVLVATALGAMNGSISIPNNVSKIGLCAFENCTNLTSITIPDSVTRIGKYAFYDCSNLREITISNSVTNIEPFAFFGCSSITEFAIPNTVKVISDSAFYDCTNLAQITIPTSVNSIGRSAFERCDNLASIIVLPSTPPSGADSMFEMISNVCPIYVPAGSVNVYKAAQYWSDYADRIKANPDSDSIVSITLSEAGALKKSYLLLKYLL